MNNNMSDNMNNNTSVSSPQSPWSSLAPAAPACSLTDVMSEQLARQLEDEDSGFPALTE